MEENQDALKVFFQVKHQFIMGPSGPIDMNHLAIEASMRREGIADKDCFRKVCALGRWWIDKVMENHASS